MASMLIPMHSPAKPAEQPAEELAHPPELVQARREFMLDWLDKDPLVVHAKQRRAAATTAALSKPGTAKKIEKEYVEV